MDKHNMENEEMTFKELVDNSKSYIKEIFRNWVFILISILICSGLFYLKHRNAEVIYPAEIKFIVDNDDSNGGMIGNLLGQFGIRKQSKNNPYKILEVARSNRIFKEIIEGEIGNENIANYLLNTYNLIDKWSQTYPHLENFNYVARQTEDSTTNLALNKMKTFVWGGKDKKDAKLKIAIDEDSGVFYINANTLDEDLSLSLVNQTYEKVKYFFENELIKTQLNSLEIINAKVDSLDNLRRSKSYEYSKFEDQNRSSLSYVTKTKKELLRQEIQAVAFTYTELLKNKELAEISLNDRKSSFMKIDNTISPILPNRSSLLISLILGIAIGFIIGSFIVVFRKLIRELLK